MEKLLKFTFVVIVVLLGGTVSVGCTKDDPLNPAQDQGVTPPLNENLNPPSNNGESVDHPVTCTTLAECENYDDKEVSIVGVYTKFEMGVSKGYSFDGRIQIVLVGGGGPLLGRYWHAESNRDPSEISMYEGRWVVVVGRYRVETPPNPDNPPHASQFSIPCILEVRSIDLAEDEEPDLEPDGGGEDATLNPADLPQL